MSVYAEMRAILSLDLKPNELRVLMTYRLEMDEQSREVRGKTQDDLAAVAGLSRSQFSSANSALEKRGLIEVQKCPNAANRVSVNRMSEFRTSGNPNIGHPEIPTSGCPESEHPLYNGSSISAPKSAPVRASTRDDDRMPDHVKPISNWSQAFAQPGDDHGVELVNDKLVLINGTRSFWLDQFDGDAKALDLALIAARGSIQPNSRSHSLKAQTERQLSLAAGRRHDQDQRYAKAVANNQKTKAGGNRTGKPTLAEVLAKRKAAEASAV